MKGIAEVININEFPIFQIGFSFILFFAYLLVKKFLFKVVLKRTLAHNFDETRSTYIKKAVRVGLLIILMVLVAIVWDVSFKGLSVYIASILTVVGVGFFANWSMISNITASVILFFFFPFKIGSKVRINDGDNSVEGIVLGVSLFSIKIQREDGKEIYFPNNLAIQKSIIDLSEKNN